MADAIAHLTPTDGELLIHTDVTGRAARMGHRLTIAMTTWQATVTWHGAEPSAVELTVDVDSLTVLRGDGGVTPLSGPEKSVVRSNALGCLNVRRHPQIRFRTDDVAASADGYRLTGILEIQGQQRPQVVDVAAADGQLSSEAILRQSAFGIKPYSMMMGSLKVVDEVTVGFSAQLPMSERPPAG